VRACVRARVRVRVCVKQLQKAHSQNLLLNGI